MSIRRCLDWDNGYEQQFLGVSPVWDEILLFQTHHPDALTELNDISKVGFRLGFDNIHCFDYLSAINGMVAVACSGENLVLVFDIKQEGSSVLKLGAETPRAINALAMHEDLVAVGLDKARKDGSFKVWNVEHYSRNSSNNHISDATSSLLPDEAVTLVGLVDRHTATVGLAKYLRQLDLRDPGQPAWLVATKLVHGIAYDPFDPNIFGTHSEEGSVAIWDRRRLGGTKKPEPLMLFARLVPEFVPRKHQAPCMRFSLIRRGEFATVYDGDLIRRWDTQRVPAVDTEASGAENSAVTKQTSDTPELSALKNQCAALYRPNQDQLAVSIVLDVKTDYERVVSFDYLPDLMLQTLTNFVCMRQLGLVFRMPAVECIEEFNFGPRGDFSYCGPEGTTTWFLPPDNTAPVKKTGRMDLALNDDFKKYAAPLEGSDDDEVFSDDDAEDMYLLVKAPDTLNLDPQQVIYNDIGNVIRRRAVLGYGINDCANNIKVLENIDALDGQMLIRNTWKWLDLAKRSLDKGAMVSDGVDLGFQGVLGIWKGPDVMQEEVRTAKDTGPLTHEAFKKAVALIVLAKGKKTALILIPAQSQKKAERMLCLIVLGWYLANAEFEEKLRILVLLGFTTKAAGWAVFHGDIKKAIDILARAKSERLRIIATAIAGYLAYKNSTVNSPWKDQCRRMALDLDDPYLRAIFAYIADNDWWDVLDEHLLPLRERLGVALLFLSDKDLDVYLTRIADTVVHRGDLEGLILTGVTPRGIDLLQSYVDRTQDVQTAALILAYGCPRYFTSRRVKHWVDCYRNLLNLWGMFSARATLDVARTRLSRNFNGHPTLRANPKQVHLQCLRCNRNFAKPVGQLAAGSANGSGSSGGPLLLKQFNKLQMNKLAQSDIVCCVHCGAPFPRCLVCLLTLGTPLPEGDAGTGKFREWFSFCLSCNHGCHAHHAEEWFRKHYVCPVPLCNCRCNSK